MVHQRHRGWIRFGLIYLAVTIGVVAAWILIAPKGFYDTFPGGGTHWVSALPPYNEHLERDFGAGFRQRNRDRLAHDKVNSELEGVIESYELAFRMQLSVPEVADICLIDVGLAGDAVQFIGDSLVLRASLLQCVVFLGGVEGCNLGPRLAGFDFGSQVGPQF